MASVASPPSQDSLIETNEQDPGRKNPFYISKSWLVWILDSLLAAIQDVVGIAMAPGSQGGTLTDRHTSIAATPLEVGDLPGGTYRVTYNLRVTTIDGVSSSVTVTFGWVEGGLALPLSGPALASDSVNTPQSGTFMATIDENSSITYGTIYASNTPNKMRFKLEFLLEGPF